MKNRSPLNYICRGDLQNPAVIFLHGFLGNLKDWEKIISLLEKNFFCVAVDLPGHGKSEITKEDNFKTLSHSLSDLTASLKDGPWNVVGYSMGGRIALYWSVHFPQKISKLVLESASPGIKNTKERQQRLIEDQNRAIRLKKENFMKFLNDWYRLPLFGKINQHKDFSAMLQNRFSNLPENLSRAWVQFSTGSQPSFWRELASIKFPVLLVSGEDDLKYKEICREMQTCNQSFQWEVLADTAHNTHFENPDLFAEHLIQFLSLRNQ